MLSAEGISYGTRDREILYEISLRAEAGEFVGIIGPNGSGKSTLLKNLYKVLRPRAGRAFLMGEDLLAMSGREMAQRLAVVVQEHESGFDFTVEEVVRMGRHARKGLLEADNGQDRSLVDRVLRLTQLEEVREQSYTTLSGGEKQRVLIARALVQDTPCLILDEPTNHLDIDSREWIEEAVEAYDGTLLFVSHDRYFINRFATRIWELTDGTITDYPCGFAQYRQMKAQEEAEKAAAPKPEKEREKPAAERPQRGNKAQQAARRQLTICERDIAKAEERIAALEADMEAAACDYEKLNELVGQKDAAQAELDALYERWEQLSEEAEG